MSVELVRGNMSRKVFLDVGANVGQNIRNFRNVYGSDYEVFSFEANPKGIAAIRQKYGSDPLVTIMEYAASDSDSTAQFYLGPGDVSVSSSLMSNKTTGIKHDRYVTVQTLDLSKWIRENFSSDDEIILYIDIEGAEYPVLTKLINDNMLGWFNEAYLEFHEKKLSGFDMQVHNNIYNTMIEHFQDKVYIFAKYQQEKYERIG